MIELYDVNGCMIYHFGVWRDENNRFCNVGHYDHNDRVVHSFVCYSGDYTGVMHQTVNHPTINDIIDTARNALIQLNSSTFAGTYRVINDALVMKYCINNGRINFNHFRDILI